MGDTLPADKNEKKNCAKKKQYINRHTQRDNWCRVQGSPGQGKQFTFSWGALGSSTIQDGGSGA